jgi:FMN-dependent NADH-azoreductase
MPSLLHLDSSADPVDSRSRAITAAFAEAWRAADPANTVVYRDLHRNPLPHLADASLHWAEGFRGEVAAEFRDAERLQREVLDELLAADVLLIGAPLYNYSLPSSLKAWVDHIHVPGVTAPFGDVDRPLADRPAVVVTSRGGSYDAGTPTADWDHAVPVLRIILGEALGMDVSVITTSLTLAERLPGLEEQIPRSRRELAEAHDAAAALARTLSAAVHA